MMENVSWLKQPGLEGENELLSRECRDHIITSINSDFEFNYRFVTSGHQFQLQFVPSPFRFFQGVIEV